MNRTRTPPALVRLLDRATVATLLSLSISTLKRRERADPDFPRPHLIGPRRLAFRADDVERYRDGLADRFHSRKPMTLDPFAGGSASAAARRARAALAQATAVGPNRAAKPRKPQQRGR